MDNFMILTHKEIERIKEYCNKNNNKNVIILSYNEGIGNIHLITLQTEYNRDKECLKEDITDYEAW